MSLFDKLSESLNEIVKSSFQNNDNCNQEEYDKYNNERIKEFKDRYDLTSVAGIRSIPAEEAKRYSDGGKSVVYMPEQILSRQATEYKNNNQFDLAIECLRKVNELYPLSFYEYTRDNYERLVDFLVLAGRFDEARKEHKEIDKLHGTRLAELRKLQDFCVSMGEETREEYQKRVIDPYIQESKDREQYYWLLENMPDVAPKSFGGYRRMKNNNSANYQKIAEKVKEKGKNIDELDFWNR